MEEKTVNTLINIGQSKIAEKVYDDLVSLPAKKVGMALSTIVEIGNTVLWPVKWVNERTRIYFETNIKKYEERLNQISETDITNVPTEISMPILHRFTYLSNKELSNAFVNLLASASSTATVDKVHPGFIYTIDRLAPDEAKILAYLKYKEDIPVLEIKFYEDIKERNFEHIALNVTGIQNKVKLDNPLNIDLYLDNLISLGLIKIVDYYNTDLDDEYIEIQDGLKSEIEKYRKLGVEDDTFNKQVRTEKHMYSVTNYGRLFLDTCIDSNNE